MKRLISLALLAAASSFASVDTGLIALLPSSAKLVAGIDLVQCRSSDFGQYLLSKSQANDPHFEQFMTQTGFDPRRDLDSVVIASPGEMGTKDSSFTILARGTFDQSKITNLAIQKGAAASTYQNISLLITKEKNGQQVALGFLDSGVVVMGDLASVQQAVQNLTTPSTLDVELSNRSQQAGAANDAWFASMQGAGLLGKEIAATAGAHGHGQMQAFQAVQSASGGVKFGSNVAVTLDAGTRSAQDATSLSDVFRFLASMIQMQRQQNAQAGLLASAMDQMQVSTNGNDVHLAFSLSEKSLEQIAQLSARR